MTEETRVNPETRVILMAEVDGYCMVRRPGCLPFVMTARGFRKMPLWEGFADDRAEVEKGR